ncbi:MAG: 50S ribosomal protein L6 [Candidatus Altiarchaeota archaeon]
MDSDKHHGEVELDVLDKVELSVDNHNIKVKGPGGELSRTFNENFIKFTLKDGNFRIIAESKRLPLKKQMAIMGTIRSHVKNMMEGVTDGFTYRMKIVYSHFPMKAMVQGNSFVVDNFLGEKYPRRTSILGGVKVEVKGADVTLTGIDKEKVSQTAANIEQLTKIKNLDPRVFQDGIYITEKAGKPIK